MVRRLKNLRIREISSVDAAANPYAEVLIAKRNLARTPGRRPPLPEAAAAPKPLRTSRSRSCCGTRGLPEEGKTEDEAPHPRR